ncbi:hypothetical protein [Geodermatophilus sp. SYSU D00710]
MTARRLLPCACLVAVLLLPAYSAAVTGTASPAVPRCRPRGRSGGAAGRRHRLGAGAGGRERSGGHRRRRLPELADSRSRAAVVTEGGDTLVLALGAAAEGPHLVAVDADVDVRGAQPRAMFTTVDAGSAEAPGEAFDLGSGAEASRVGEVAVGGDGTAWVTVAGWDAVDPVDATWHLVGVSGDVLQEIDLPGGAVPNGDLAVDPATGRTTPVQLAAGSADRPPTAGRECGWSADLRRRSHRPSRRSRRTRAGGPAPGGWPPRAARRRPRAAAPRRGR